MSFANLSWTGVLAGLAGLAAALFVLQRLRTRYRDVTVVTTLFWKQVIDETPVRKFWGRFRHPLAYALILAICSLVWLAFAEPQFDASQDRTFYVLVLDGSAGMAEGTRFQEAVQALERQVARLPASRRQVIWSGAEIRPLLNPGEHELLLTKRLEPLAPEAAPSSLERVLRQLSASSMGGMGGMAGGDAQATSVLVFGDAPVRQHVLNLVPSSVSVKRATTPAPLQDNRGITALGVADAASGAWDKVDVFLQVSTTGDRRVAPVVPVGNTDPLGFQLDLDGQPVLRSIVTRASQGFVVSDLPAEGGLFTVTLPANDSLTLDNSASIRLPTKPIIKVHVSASLTAMIGPVLDVDPGVTVVDDAADVVIRRGGEPVGGAGPALEFVPAAAQPQAFLLTHPDALSSGAVFATAVEDIGLKHIDAMSLAQEAGRPVEVSISAGRQWRFSIWEELLSDHFNFTRSRAFPLFVASAVRWLAGADAWYPYVAAGRPLVTASAGARAQVVDVSGRVLDPLGADFVPAGAGELMRNAGAAPLSVSLLDPDVTTGVRDEALALATVPSVDLVPDSSLATWLLVLALLLLAAEWYFVQRGRMP
jgi:hypothetical protein